MTLAPVALLPADPGIPLVQDEDDPAKQIEACGEDVEKLLELARAWKEASKEADAKKAFQRVLELDENNAEAHKGLRHHEYDGKWFKSYAELSKYRRAEAKEMKAKGLERFGDQWVSAKDLPYLRMGWTKDEDGVWRTPAEIERKAQEAAYVEKGYQLRKEDSTWIAPEDFDKWRAKQYLCGENWVSEEEANTYHSQIGTWWKAQGERFDVWATVDMTTLPWCWWHADKTYEDLVRIYGIQPSKRPLLVVLNGIEQFNIFAAGSQELQLPPAEAEGFSSLHYAYFADSWVDISVTPPEYRGTGTAYWDTSDATLNAYGKHAVKHAAGLAYAEAIDPSWLTISEAVSAGGGLDLATFWGEKMIPRWYRYGAASYVERFFQDQDAEDHWWARKWAIANLQNQGGLRKLDDVFTFGLSLEDIPGSTKLIHEAGLLISFMLDGECEAVTEKHEAFKTALGEGDKEAVTEAMEDLQKALKKNEKKIKEYAGL